MITVGRDDTILVAFQINLWLKFKKYLFIILEAILPVFKNAITRVTVSDFSADYNVSPSVFSFIPVDSNGHRVAIQKASHFNILIVSCQSEPGMYICSIGIKI